MSIESVLEGFRALVPEDQRVVADTINEEIDAGPHELSDEVKRMLDERLAHDEENPDDVFTWEEVKAEARKGLRPCHTD